MTSLIEELRAELASKQVRAQAGRFVRLTAAGLAAQTATLGTSHLDAKAAAAALVGVVEMAWRQWAPTVPWAAVAARLHLLSEQPAAAPAASQPPTANE
jgi:hypothetical protein